DSCVSFGGGQESGYRILAGTDCGQARRMSEVLARWNHLPAQKAAEEILACCGSTTWALALVARRPLEHELSLVAASDEVWSHLGSQDWMEAFSKHPR